VYDDRIVAGLKACTTTAATASLQDHTTTAATARLNLAHGLARRR
jgi:hypothetical protein